MAVVAGRSTRPLDSTPDLKTDISIPSAELRSAITASGWRIEPFGEIDAWWCRECWHLQSEWAPNEAEAFVTFLTDPLDESNPRRKIWGVKASPRAPDQWQSSSEEHTLSLGGKWREHVPRLISYLNGLRGKGAV
jgi:hypothetical protein